MNYNELIADAKTFCYNGEYNDALDFCKAAIKQEPQKEEGYLLGGQVALTFGDPNAAAQFFSDLVKVNPTGDYFYLLGQSQAMNDDGMSAIANFEKALQNNCSVENKGKIYKTMALLNVEMGLFEDGLKNIENASEFIGLDLELLKSRYLCYAGMSDYKRAIAACNQMKLISPSSYESYSMAFEILMDLGMYEEAKNELRRAHKSIDPLPQTYFDDKAKFILVSQTENNTEKLTDKILLDILNVYDVALQNLYLNSVDYDRAFTIILRGAQTYLQLNDGKNALRLIDMLWDIPVTYKRRIPILEAVPKTDKELEGVYQSDFLYDLSLKTDDERYEAFAKTKESLTPLKDIPNKQTQTTDTPTFAPYDLETSQKEIIRGLEISAYDLIKDYEAELQSAMHLQESASINSSYLGKYVIIRCEKLLGKEKWQIHYQNAIGFWKNQRLINPDDILALSYEIRCLIDIRDFDEAVKKINKLPVQNRDIFTAMIEQEKGETK